MLTAAHKTLLARIAIAVVAAGLALLLEVARPTLLNRLDEGIRDVVIRHFADPTPENRIAVIDIDDETIRRIGPWPWPRTRLADLVETLIGSQEVRSVALDIALPERGDLAGDTRLAALATHGPLILAQIFDYSPRFPSLALGQLHGGETARGELKGRRLAQGYIGLHSGLTSPRCVGNLGYQPDSDGVLRRLPLTSRFAGQDYLHLAPTILGCVAPQPLATELAQLREWRIPYHKALAAYTVIPAHWILQHELPPGWLRDRHVLVGSSSLGLGDRVSTPLAPLSAGVMVHAASLSALLDLAAGQLQPPWSGRGWSILWILASTLLATLIIARFRAWSSALALLALSLAWLGLALAGALHQAEWSITAPLWGMLVFLLLGIPHEWRLAQKRIQQAINTLGHYVSSQVLNEILRANLQYSLQPTLREVTVLIADIEGYTRMTSALSLEQAAELTKGILESLTRPLLAAGGTLDKYSGDGLVAFWGAPLDCPEQADVAVATALAMLDAVDAFNRSGQNGLPPVRVRIGIESGKALVGDLGTSFRSTYTAVGDCINFASRLESAAREHPTPLLIGPVANAKITRFATHCVGTINLRGTETFMDIFSLDRDRPSVDNIGLTTAA